MNVVRVGSGQGEGRFCTKSGETTPENSDELKSHILTERESCEKSNSSEKDKKLCEPIVEEKSLVLTKDDALKLVGDNSIPKVDTIICSTRIGDIEIVKKEKTRSNMSIATKEQEFNIYYNIMNYKSSKTGKYLNISNLIFSEGILIQAYRETSKAKGSITKGGDDSTIDDMTKSRLEKLSHSLLHNS